MDCKYKLINSDLNGTNDNNFEGNYPETKTVLTDFTVLDATRWRRPNCWAASWKRWHRTRIIWQGWTRWKAELVAIWGAMVGARGNRNRRKVAVSWDTIPCRQPRYTSPWPRNCAPSWVSIPFPSYFLYFSSPYKRQISRLLLGIKITFPYKKCNCVSNYNA